MNETDAERTERIIRDRLLDNPRAVDILDAAKTSRRFDRQPETEADKRFFDLRESGYDGWIDQDGRAADGPTWLDRDGNKVAGFGPADCEYVDGT